jgi:hypothetical protein
VNERDVCPEVLVLVFAGFAMVLCYRRILFRVTMFAL